MQGILAKRHYLVAVLLVLLLSFSLAACDTNSIMNGTNGNATSDGEEGINAGSEGDSDAEPFEIQEVPGSDDGRTSGTDGDADSALAGQTPGTPPDTAIQPDEGMTGTGTAEPTDGATGTATAEPTGQVGQDADAQEVADCFEADPHPIGEVIAQDFDADYDEVMGWMCAGFSFEDILLALQTSELSGRPAGEILDETGSRSWSLIWQEAGLAPSSPQGDAGDDLDLDGDSQDSQMTATPAPGGDDDAEGTTPEPFGTATPDADDAADDNSTDQMDGEGQMVFEDGAMRWTDDEFELTGTVVRKDEATRTIDLRALNEEGVEQVYAFDVGENGIFEEVEEGDRVRVTGERLEDGTVVAYEMQALPGNVAQDGDDDGDDDAGAQDRPGSGVSRLAPGEFEFRGTIVSADPDERSFELQVAPAGSGLDGGLDLDDLLEGDDDTSTSPLSPTSPTTGTNGPDDSDVVTGTNGLDDADESTSASQPGQERTYTFYVPEGLSFDAFGVGDVIEVEIEPLDVLGLTGDDNATDDSDLSGDDSSTGDPDLSGNDANAGQDMDDSLNGDAREDAWRMVEFELTGTVENVDDTAGTIDVLVRYEGGIEETYTFDVADDNLRDYYQAGDSVEIEVQLEATAAEMGQREVLNGDQDDDLAPGTENDDAGDDADVVESPFRQETVGLGAGEFEFRGTIVSVDEAENSFDLRPDARYALEMGQQDGDVPGAGTDTITATDEIAGPEIITGTDEITGTDTMTGTNGIDASESVTGTNGTASEGQLEDYTFYLPRGLSSASFGVGDVIEVEIEPAVTGGLFGLDDDLMDDQDDVDLAGNQDDTGSNAGQDDVGLGDDQDDADSDLGTGTDDGALGAGDDQDAQPDATGFASIELMGEVVAMDREAGTIEVRLMPADDVTGTNGLTDGDSSDALPSVGVTSTQTVTGTEDSGDDVDDDMAPLGQGQAEEIYVFYIADVAAQQYYRPGTLVEIEIDLEERADRAGLDGGAGMAGQFCAAGAAGEHALATGIAETYGADVDEIRGWYCEDNLGFGEIMLALTTARASGEPADELAGRRVDGEGWGEIWQDLDLINDAQDAGEMNDRLSDD